MSINTRVTEALLSGGRITVVAAHNYQEELFLQSANFPRIGTMNIDGSTVALYSVYSVQSVCTPTKSVIPAKYVSTGTTKYKVTYKGVEQNFK